MGQGEWVRRWAVAVLSVAVAAVLVTATVGVVLEQVDDRPAASGLAPEPPPETVVEMLPSLQAFVERERGLRFKAPVRLTPLEDAAFRGRVLQAGREDRREVEEAQAVLQAMGLLEPGTDLVRVVENLLAAAVVGLYDPKIKELVVRGVRPTPFLRLTVVHELTHALEDQHFDIDRDELGDEAGFGFTALVEGSARRIEERYRDTLSAKERADVALEEAKGIRGAPSDVPEAVVVGFQLPYTHGPRLVTAILEAGGQARLDSAFRDPPSSTEQVLSPRRYLQGDDPRPVPVPRADGPPFDDGEIGEAFLVLMLRRELDREGAREAARGWGGDHYVAWKAGGRTCVRMDFVMDTGEDSQELALALQAWARRRPGAAATGTSLTTCA